MILVIVKVRIDGLEVSNAAAYGQQLPRPREHQQENDVDHHASHWFFQVVWDPTTPVMIRATERG